MKYLIAAIMFLMIALLPSVAAAEFHFGAGLGKQAIKNQLGQTGPFERFAVIGYSKDLWRGIGFRGEIGGYLTYGENEKHSPYGSAMIQFMVESPTGVSSFFAIGPTYLMFPDNVKLSGHLQCMMQFGLVLCSKWLCAGPKWLHISNAGRIQPNIGRDALMAEITLRFF